MDRGDWWATIHGVAKNQTGLNDPHFNSASSVISIIHQFNSLIYQNIPQFIMSGFFWLSNWLTTLVEYIRKGLCLAEDKILGNFLC